MAILYETYFHLRAKNSSGTVQKTFSPLAGIGRNVEVNNSEPMFLERELLTYTTSNYCLGQKQTVKATFTDTAGKYIRGLAAGTGSDKLEDVINALAAGCYLEYQIDNASVSSGTWVPCELVKFDRKKLAGKNQALTATVELTSRAFVSTPLAVS